MILESQRTHTMGLILVGLCVATVTGCFEDVKQGSGGETNGASGAQDSSSPTATVVPANGAAVHGSTPIVVTFNESISPSSLVLSGGMASEAGVPVWSTLSNSNDRVTLGSGGTWTQGIGRTLTVSAKDVAGNLLQGAPMSLSYEVDDTLPVASLNAASGSTIAEGTQIVLTFDDAMDAASLALGGTLAAASNGGVFSSVTNPNDRLALSPSTTWPSDAQTLTVSIKDNAGNSYGSGTLNFTVIVTPTVNNVSPADGSTLATSGSIQVTFSEAMNPASVSLAGTMTGSGQVLSPSSGVAWSAGNTVLTLTPTTAWTAGCGRTLTVDVNDANGNALLPYTLTYGTGSLAASISNLRTNGLVETGFVIGTASGCTSVEVSLDGGAYTSTTVGTAWKFQLPTGANTWRDNNQHTIAVRARNASGTSTPSSVNVRKGVNKDVNGDGYADIVAGAYGYSSSKGRVYVFHSAGSAGVSATQASGANTIITGENASDEFGDALAIGDVNGDGYADFVVGVNSYNASIGRVYVFHSSGSSGITITNAASANTKIDGENSEGNGDQLGTSVAVGDVNGDGYADVIAGSPDYDSSPTVLNNGRVYVFHSSGAAGVTVTAATSANRIITGPDSGLIGTSVAVGDVNGDGFADLAVGAPFFSSFTGRVYLHHSAGSGGISATVSTTIDGQAPSDQFGRWIAFGDVTGDGYADLVTVAPGYPSGTDVNGRVYVFHSPGTGGITVTQAANANTRIAGSAITDRLGGGGVATGDVNGDGYADVVAGGSGYSSDQGRTYIFQSTGSAGISATVAGDASTIVTGGAASDSFGGSVATGDLNGDGYADVISAAYGYSTNRGRVYAFHSSGSGGITATTVTAGAGGPDTTITGENGQDFFGIPVW